MRTVGWDGHGMPPCCLELCGWAGHDLAARLGDEQDHSAYVDGYMAG